MPYLINLVYAVALMLLSPWLLVRAVRTGRYRANWRCRLLGHRQLDELGVGPRVWFHGVSVGEVQLLRRVIGRFRPRYPDWHCIVSASTETGLVQAHQAFSDLTVLPWPMDFSWAVRRSLDTIQPRVIVLAEGELWPNLLHAAEQRNIPVLVINARLSPRSFARYRRLAWLLRPLLLQRVTEWAVQSEHYATQLQTLGVDPERIHITGSVKYDGAIFRRDDPRVAGLRQLLGLAATDRVWVAGSTHAPEEKVVLDTFRRLRVRFPNLRLLLVPRKPERFDEVAALLNREHFAFVRRSQTASPSVDRPAVILVDSMGELDLIWGLADLGFVGGSLDGQRGGQSMIEPAGYGVPTVFGPAVWNFRDVVARLLEANAAIQIQSPQGLFEAVRRLLDDPIGRERMGVNARQLVRQQQGAVERTLALFARVTPSIALSERRAS